MFKNNPHYIAALESILTNRDTEYRSASWLKTAFDAPLWNIYVDDTSITLNWHLHLPDGSLLTDSKNSVLLTTFKCWLCIQDHPDTTSKIILTPVSAYRRIQKITHLIDYFLINADELKLATHGLALVTENDIKRLIFRFIENSSVSTCVYNWSSRLDAFLRTKLTEINEDDCSTAIQIQPELINLYEDVPLTNLSGPDLVKARVWLWKNGLYLRAGPHAAHLYRPDTTTLAINIYANTIWGTAFFKPIPPELLLFPVDIGQTEFPRAPVRNQDDDRMSIEQLRPVLRRLQSLSYLTRVGLPVPTSALSAVEDKSIYSNLKIAGRYRTLPQEVVFTSLRHSIEFGLEYGQDLVDTYLRIVRAWTCSDQTSTLGVYAAGLDLEKIVPEKLKLIGVQKWSISRSDSGQSPFISNSEYYYQLRANAGLIELLRVFCGCVSICIGTLMARRIGELEELPPDCLDSSRTRLIFRPRKSGLGGHREIIARPIPNISVALISILQSLHRGLAELCQSSETGPLIGYPDQLFPRLISGTTGTTNSLDTFCDYFSLPLDEEGRRYYIRQHQLRRFFAMLFFWGNAFGGMETLRWFLAQTDVEHLYHYITESMTGKALATVKAGYATDRLLQDAPDVQELADLLRSRYGTEAFSLMARDELDEHISDLINDSMVSIEPDFFVTSNGKEYRILIKVTTKKST